MYRINADQVWASTVEVAKLYKWALHSLYHDPSVPHRDSCVRLLLDHTTVNTRRVLYMEGVYQLSVRRFKNLSSEFEPKLLTAFRTMLPLIGRRILDRVDFNDNTRMRLSYSDLDIETCLERRARYENECFAKGLEPQPMPEGDRRAIQIYSSHWPSQYFPHQGEFESVRRVLEALYAKS